MKQIVVDILDDGEVRIETKGFSGPVCLAESQFLKDLLGTETARSLAASFYQRHGVPMKRHIPLCG